MDSDTIREIAAREALDPDYVRERLEAGLPLREEPLNLSADWDDFPPFEALPPRWQRIERLPDGYCG